MVYSQWTDGVSGKITFIIYMIIPLSQWKDHKYVQTLIPLTQWNQPLPFQNVENYFGCAKKAAENAQAKFWTYVTSSKECWIKRSNKEKKPLKTAVSGNVECGQ